MIKLVGYLHLMRPINCLMMGFAVLVGAVLADLSSLNSGSRVSLAYGFLTGFMLTAASMAINDYHDRDIDTVNEPNRPIPSKAVTPREALFLAATLTAIGFAAAFLTNILCLFTAFVAWVVFTAYTTVGKRSGLPGNFLVSTCVAIPFIYGSLAVTGLVRLNVLFFVSMVFLSNTGREITKGIVDVQGDKVQNVKTLAVRYGEKSAAVAAAFFYLSAVSLSPIPWRLGIVSFWFLPLVALTDFGLAASSVMLLRDYSRENARRIKRNVLSWFLLGLLSFIAGTLW
jgi:geranylgeranylglycerol-phosphate geranylgeranyltransferase